MSIASQIERLNNEVSTQEALIAQIASALEGKVGGSRVGVTCRAVATSTLVLPKHTIGSMVRTVEILS